MIGIRRGTAAFAVSGAVIAGVTALAAATPGMAKSKCSVGYSYATGQNTWMVRIETAAKPVLRKAGCSIEVGDAQLSEGKAVQQLTRFVSDGDSEVVVAPAQVPQAVQGILAKAHKQGIHTFAVEWSYTSNPTAAPPAPIDGQVDLDRGGVAKAVDSAINKAFPKGAQVMYVGLPFPVVGVDFFFKTLKADLGKSKLTADVSDPSDNAQGALGPESAALQAHPGIRAIVTYNGPAALGAVQAVKQAGLTGKVKIYNIQLDTATAAALKAGTITASWDLNPAKMGQALGKMMAAAGQGKPRSQWAKTVVINAPMYTKATIKTWKDWSKS